MYRILMCAAAGVFLIASQAIAQEKVSFPSADGDLKGAPRRPSLVICTSPRDQVLLRPSSVCMGAVAS